MRTFAFMWLALFAAAFPAAAQPDPTATASPGSPLTADDTLDVATYSILGVSDDGQRVAVAARPMADSPEMNNSRHADPPYISPARARLMVIDTLGGAAREPFKDLVNVQQVAWSHDGRRLAILTAVNGVAPGVGQPSMPIGRLFIWDAKRPALTETRLAGDLRLAADSALEWLPDDSRIIAACRSLPERDGPRRWLRRRTLVELDPRTGRTTPLVTDALITSFAVSGDGSFITFLEDVTGKTGDDEINGAVNDVRLLARPGAGAPRTVAAGKDLEGLQLRWSDDGRAFAYARRGEVFVQRVNEEKPRSLTREVNEKPAAATPGGGDEADKKEQFSVVSFSRDGAVLLATTKKGWYVIRVADGSRRAVLTFDAANEKAGPRIEPIAWSPDGEAIYASWSARDGGERGLVRINVINGELTPLVRDARRFGGFQFSRDGRTVVFTMSDGGRPAEVYAADHQFATIRRLTHGKEWVPAARQLPPAGLKKR